MRQKTVFVYARACGASLTKRVEKKCKERNTKTRWNLRFCLCLANLFQFLTCEIFGSGWCCCQSMMVVVVVVLPMNCEFRLRTN